MKVTFDNMPDVPGFEYTGEFRYPVFREWYMRGETGLALQAPSGVSIGHLYPILRKKRWRAEYHMEYSTRTHSGEIAKYMETADDMDKALHSLCNYYPPDWFDEHPAKLTTLGAELKAAYLKAGQE